MRSDFGKLFDRGREYVHVYSATMMGCKTKPLIVICLWTVLQYVDHYLAGFPIFMKINTSLKGHLFLYVAA